MAAKGYWVGACRTVSDPENPATYDKPAGPAVEAGGGRLLALSDGAECDVRIVDGV
ncbi:DUF1330 domain-containing protein [Kitasatospora paranensis]|uniref:DUF1330 domain-containing protein n=1 Tax=Kitasatospora paranensis TaxID=258053 RepID=A0ABW2G9W8_9ACTN